MDFQKAPTILKLYISQIRLPYKKNKGQGNRMFFRGRKKTMGRIINVYLF
jgi:hypothetical protein